MSYDHKKGGALFLFIYSSSLPVSQEYAFFHSSFCLALLRVLSYNFHSLGEPLSVKHVLWLALSSKL